MRKFKPTILFDNESRELISDEIVRKWHTQLLKNLGLLSADSNDEDLERI